MFPKRVGRPEDDRVAVREIIRLDDVCRLVHLHTGRLHGFHWHEFRHPPDLNFCAFNSPGTGCHCIGKGFHMAIRAVVDDHDFGCACHVPLI